MTSTTILLQAGGAMGGQSGMWIMLLIFFAIMYFFMIRPQNKKQKEIQRFRSSLEVGQKVVTAGGIHGTIKEIQDTLVILEIARDTRITIEKSSIYQSAADTTATK